MPRKILLDSDHLIPFCARNKNSSTYLEVVNLLKAGAKLYCTSLLRYEVLRGLSATDPKFPPLQLFKRTTRMFKQPY